MRINIPMIEQSLQALVASISQQMEDADAAREHALPLHRRCIRECSLAIRAVHRYDYDEAKQHIKQAKQYLDSAADILRPHPEIYYAGFIQDAQKEYAEANLTYEIVTSSRFPTPDDLCIDTAPYVNGLAETVGELRRHVLDHIRLGNYNDSERLLKIMDEVYYVLITLDFPDAITRGLRRSTDIARGCLEKTRGDLTASQGHIQLKEELAYLRSEREKNSQQTAS